MNFYAGVFCITSATLALQIVQTRILSVVTWYHLAFFVISVAMFGMTLGAIWVYAKGERFSVNTLSQDLAYFSAAFALSTGLSLAVQMTLPPVLASTVAGAIVWIELAIAFRCRFSLAALSSVWR